MRRELRVLLMGDAFLLFAIGLFGPLYAVFVQEIGGDLLTAGWAYATYAITTGVLILVISRFEDRLKRKEAMVPLGYSLFALAAIGYLLVKTPAHLFMVQVLLGIAEAITDPAWDGLYSRFLDKGRFSTEWGFEEAQNYIFPAIAAALGGMIATFYGFRTLFVVMFVCAFIGTLISLQLLRSNSRKSSA